MNFMKFKVSQETFNSIIQRKKIINLIFITFIGYHAYRTYLITIAANEKRKEREIIEKRYSDFCNMLTSDEWLNGLETQIRTKKERNVKSYVRGIYTTIDKDWTGPTPNYVEGMGPII